MQIPVNLGVKISNSFRLHLILFFILNVITHNFYTASGFTLPNPTEIPTELETTTFEPNPADPGTRTDSDELLGIESKLENIIQTTEIPMPTMEALVAETETEVESENSDHSNSKKENNNYLSNNFPDSSGETTAEHESESNNDDLSKSDADPPTVLTAITVEVIKLDGNQSQLNENVTHLNSTALEPKINFHSKREYDDNNNNPNFNLQNPESDDEESNGANSYGPLENASVSNNEPGDTNNNNFNYEHDTAEGKSNRGDLNFRRLDADSDIESESTVTETSASNQSDQDDLAESSQPEPEPEAEPEPEPESETGAESSSSGGSSHNYSHTSKNQSQTIPMNNEQSPKIETENQNESEIDGQNAINTNSIAKLSSNATSMADPNSDPNPNMMIIMPTALGVEQGQSVTTNLTTSVQDDTIAMSMTPTHSEQQQEDSVPLPTPVQDIANLMTVMTSAQSYPIVDEVQDENSMPSADLTSDTNKVNQDHTMESETDEVPPPQEQEDQLNISTQENTNDEIVSGSDTVTQVYKQEAEEEKESLDTSNSSNSNQLDDNMVTSAPMPMSLVPKALEIIPTSSMIIPPVQVEEEEKIHMPEVTQPPKYEYESESEMNDTEKITPDSKPTTSPVHTNDSSSDAEFVEISQPETARPTVTVVCDNTPKRKKPSKNKSSWRDFLKSILPKPVFDVENLVLTAAQFF